MYFIKLDDLKTVNQLAKLCEKYKNYMDIDICHGRYIVDGASVLGVASLIGHIVRINPILKEDILIADFFKELKGIGGWDNTTKNPARFV